MDRLLVPGNHTALAALPGLDAWARQRYGRPVDLLQKHETSFAYDAALRYVAQTEGHAVASAAAYNLVYPTGHLVLAGATWSPALVTGAVALSLLGLAAVWAFA